MPYVELITNVAISEEQRNELCVDLTNAAAEILSKPAALFAVCIRAGESFTYGGTSEPGESRPLLLTNDEQFQQEVLNNTSRLHAPSRGAEYLQPRGQHRLCLGFHQVA